MDRRNWGRALGALALLVPWTGLSIVMTMHAGGIVALHALWLMLVAVIVFVVYNVVAVITLASPVITSPSTSYHTLHMTPTGDKVGDDPTLNTISPLWPPFADSYHKQAGDAGQGYEVDLGEKGHQHGNLSIYLDLADKFDDKTTTGYTAIKRAILAFGGGIETGVGPATSSD